MVYAQHSFQPFFSSAEIRPFGSIVLNTYFSLIKYLALFILLWGLSVHELAQLPSFRKFNGSFQAENLGLCNDKTIDIAIIIN